MHPHSRYHTPTAVYTERLQSVFEPDSILSEDLVSFILVDTVHRHTADGWLGQPGDRV